jgi:hypothetical protein
MENAAIDSTFVIVRIILILLFGLGLCALEGFFIHYDLVIGLVRTPLISLLLKAMHLHYINIVGRDILLFISALKGNN